jgi:hypothetical protein
MPDLNFEAPNEFYEEREIRESDDSMNNTTSSECSYTSTSSNVNDKSAQNLDDNFYYDLEIAKINDSLLESTLNTGRNKTDSNSYKNKNFYLHEKFLCEKIEKKLRCKRKNTFN